MIASFKLLQQFLENCLFQYSCVYLNLPDYRRNTSMQKDRQVRLVSISVQSNYLFNVAPFHALDYSNTYYQ